MSEWSYVSHAPFRTVGALPFLTHLVSHLGESVVFPKNLQVWRIFFRKSKQLAALSLRSSFIWWQTRCFLCWGWVGGTRYIMSSVLDSIDLPLEVKKTRGPEDWGNGSSWSYPRSKDWTAISSADQKLRKKSSRWANPVLSLWAKKSPDLDLSGFLQIWGFPKCLKPGVSAECLFWRTCSEKQECWDFLF